MRKVYCDYCGRQAEYVDSKVIYGKSYGMMYLCRNCMAYVGVHKGTDKPLGRLANAELRYWKKAARLRLAGPEDGLAGGEDPHRDVRCGPVP